MPSPMTTDTQFEKTFSELAFSVIQDKAPALLDHMLGFQVLDVNEEQTKAVGIFGFKVGKELIYLPVFFSNGELKGTELMYLKNQDIFAPLQESWVQYIMNRRPYKMGDPSEFERQELFGGGGDLYEMRRSPELGKAAAAQTPTTPDYYMIKKGNKLASLQIPCWRATNVQPWAYILSPDVLLTDDFAKQAAENLDFINFLGDLDSKSIVKVARSLRNDPKFGPAVLKFYPVEKITSVQPREKKAEAKPVVGDVTILTFNEKDRFEGLTLKDNEKQKLLAGEIVIKDHRNDTSKVYNLDVPRKYQPPPETGIYNIVFKDGDIRRCLVLVNPCEPDVYSDTYPDEPRTHTEGRTNDISFAVNTHIINLDGPGCCERDRDKLLADPVGDGSVFGNQQLLEELSEDENFQEDNCYTIVHTSGRAIAPFCVLKKRDGVDGQTSLFVTHNLDPRTHEVNRWEDKCEIVFQTGRKGPIKKVGSVIFVPEESCRYLKVNVTRVRKKDQYSGEMRPMYEDEKGYKPNYGMPDPEDSKHVEKLLWNSDGTLPLKVYANSGDYQLTLGRTDDAIKTAGMIPYMNALRTLIFSYGVEGNTAKDMLKQADLDSMHRVPTRFLIQLADGFPTFFKQAQPNMTNLTGGGGYGPPMIEQPYYTDASVGVPVTDFESEHQQIEALSPGTENLDMYNPDPNLDTNIYDMLGQAAETGQKEVFDTALIGGLLSTSSSETLVDKYIGDLILGMDRVGRIYFLYLQHYEDFKERYGQEDLIELEDSLRNTFESLGDLILFLKQKTVQSSPEIDQTEEMLS